jgi:hypothetical protein
MMSKRRTSVRPDAAIARRRHRRPTPDAKSSDWKIDEGLKESFPASDPPSWTPLARIGAPRRREGDLAAPIASRTKAKPAKGGQRGGLPGAGIC